MTTQSKTVAEIALTLSEKPQPSAVEIIAALNRAYHEGYQAGFAASSLYETKTREFIERLMP